jgi:lysophospholipase L1-like esterase
MSAEYPSSASMKAAMAAYNDIVRRIASDLQVPIVDLEPSVPRDLRHFIDDVHYTPEGARRVADLAWPVVEAEISRRLR